MIDDRSHYLIIVEEARCRILPSLCTLSTLDKVFYFIAGVRAYFPGRMRVPEPDERNAPQILPRHGLWVCECAGACAHRPNRGSLMFLFPRDPRGGDPAQRFSARG